MDQSEHPITPRKVGRLMALWLKIVGVDKETLQQCPEQDWQSVAAMGTIMLCTFIYQSGVFALISHQLFALAGEFRPELVVVSLFLAWFVLEVDSYQLMRGGWFRSGVRALRDGGIDIGGSIFSRIGAGISLTVRIALSIGLTQLTAIFVALLVFASDIESRNQDTWSRGNHDQIIEATTFVDAGIKRATEPVATATARVSSLSAQVAALRQMEVDPSASDPRIQQSQQELAQLVAQKAKVDEELRAAETFMSNELAGIKGAAGNSGRPGPGVRRKAATEQVDNLRRHSAEINKNVDAARVRLDLLRQQVTPADDNARQRSNDKRVAFENTLEAENADLAKLKAELANLTTDRASAIRKAVEQAPNHVAYPGGILDRLVTLDHIVQENKKIGMIVILIEVVAFGFEAAAVLAKVATYIPTSYAPRNARNVHVRTVEIAEELDAELEEIERRRQRRAENAAREGVFDPLGPDLTGGLHDNQQSAPPPIKRKRGRPRKYPAAPTNGTGLIIPERPQDPPPPM
jgi:hypothetical protein